MTRLEPSYIPAPLLQAMPLTHKWDDWDPYPLLPPNELEVEALLGRISDFGKLVFSIGCAQWVVGRFGNRFRDERPWQFIDACWAYELSEGFALPDELEDNAWEGPILGPTCLSLTTILNTRYGFDEDNAEVDAAFAEKVVRFVMPDRTVFERWRDTILGRLVTVAPVDGNPAPGLRLAPAILDPTIAIDPSTLDSLRKASLEALKLIDNPFVVRMDDTEE